MSKLSAIVSAIILSIFVCSYNVSAKESLKSGDVFGEVLETDIAAFIDERPIESYNVFGYTYVIAEQLENYGFDVLWDEQKRILTINRNSNKEFVLMDVTKVNRLKKDLIVGKKVFNILFTDIKTLVGNKEVPAYNINGQTVMCFEDLAEMGYVNWDEVNRQIKLGMMAKELDLEFENAPNKVKFEFDRKPVQEEVDYRSWGVNRLYGFDEGELQGDKLNGIGKRDVDIDIPASGGHTKTEKYIGIWKNGIKSGKCVSISTNYDRGVHTNTTFIGVYNNGHIDYKGIEKGSYNVFEGEWNEERLNGYSRIGNNDKNFLYGYVITYEGNMERGSESGFGKIFYPETGKVFYEGEFAGSPSKYNGQGKIFTEEGKIEYDGEWHNGKPINFNSNDGKLYDGNAKLIYEGEIKAGLQQGFGLELFRGETYYEGLWDNGKKNGAGKSYLNGVLSYDGDWKDNCQDGYGKLYENGLIKYEGQWKYGKEHGIGTSYNKDGSIEYSGRWINGQKKSAPDINSNTTENTPLVTGNSVSNIVNGGFVACDKDWVYYGIPKQGLYKEKVNGGSISLLTEGNIISEINVVNGFIYYLNYDNSSHKGTINKISTNGIEKEKIADVHAGWMHFINGWIYYSDFNDSLQLYRLSVETKTTEKICRYPCTNLRIYNGWIYVENDAEYGHPLYKMELDGSNFQRVFHTDVDDWSKINTVTFEDDAGYYPGKDYYNLQINTENTSKLLNNIWRVNVTDKWVYYSKIDEGIYKVKTDGTNKTLLMNFSGKRYNYISSINVIGEWIYMGMLDYSINQEKIMTFNYDSLSRMKLDGSEFQSLYGM